MNTWYGSAACCLNENHQILMVLQGKPDEEPKWSVPSGGLEKGETLEDCCVREVWEETGYRVRIDQKLFEKRGQSYGWNVEVHYFQATVVAGSACIQDPDRLIHEIGWKSWNDITTLSLAFPEDREFLLQFTHREV
ncbi:NUDIX hydrolase [Alicyclobacillus fastidiosus]|uniref:NUDIX hydrolase n=1 Tax=Alicyclobacillus fastidiosus TaxID=392011 RepID=A0ABV5AKD1_9BACL|nr:NUDIX hydrolase [Alicyclobacillus fastidiosus]WEH08448.1 NUDIX hydrolase [Alicyclobacillus fastidiosus]